MDSNRMSAQAICFLLIASHRLEQGLSTRLPLEIIIKQRHVQMLLITL